MAESRRPTVAICLPSLRGGGAERACLHLAEALAEHGETVDLVLVSRVGPYLGLLPETVRLVDLGVGRVSRSIPAMAGYLHRARPKTVISAMSHVNLAVLWARRLAGAHPRVIITERNPMSFVAREVGSKNERLVPILARVTYPSAEAIVAVSCGVADDLARVLAMDRGRIRVVYNPIPAERIRQEARADPGHPWFAPGSPPVILGVGRLARQKDFATLISAFRILREARDIRLMILGEGPERAALIAQVETLGLGDSVSLPGFLPNPYPAMRRAAVVALTSAWEGFGNVLVEAMALGTPVVATRCPGGVAELLEDGAFGPLVTVGDPSAVAEAIAGALDHPLPSDLLRRRADDFSPEESVGRYLELIHGRVA